jgi:biotin carboxyl carrier protein
MTADKMVRTNVATTDPSGPAADPKAADHAGPAADPKAAEPNAGGATAGEAPREWKVDPRAVRVTVAATTRIDGDPAVTVEPAPDPATVLPGDPMPDRDDPIVDGVGLGAVLEWFGAERAHLTLGGEAALVRVPLVFGEPRAGRHHGTIVREVVVHGWRIDVELESERRAMLREKAHRGAGAQADDGPLEVHAIIPGRVVAVSVKPGDAVEAGSQLLVVEAMKMQNELRAPREGTIDRVGVAVGQTIEVGDLLVVIV